MLYKIIFKNYKHNLKRYFAFYLCNIFTVAMLFLFMGIYQCFSISEDMSILNSEMIGEYILLSVTISIVAVFMMFYSLKNYVKYRVKDYSLFLVVGMRNRKFILLLGFEYLLSWLFSLAGGLLFGNVFLRGVCWFISSQFNISLADISKLSNMWVVYRNVCIVCFVLMITVFFVLMVWMEGKDIGQIAKKEEINDKRPKSKKWLILTFFGFLIWMYGCYLYQKIGEMAGWSWVFAHIIWIVGTVVILWTGGSLVLEELRKRNFYFTHIFKVNALYSKYKNHILIIIILCSIHFMGMGYVATAAAGHLPMGIDRSTYPYDYVWMSKDDQKDFAEKLTEKYKGEMVSVPMMRVVSDSNQEQIGMAASNYESLTGKKISLSGKQVLVSVPYSRLSKKIELDPEKCQTGCEEMYLGKYTQETEDALYRAGISRSVLAENTYQVKYVISENIIGDYSKSMYTNMWNALGGIHAEDVVVFSDDYFESQYEQFENDEEEPTRLYLFKFPESGRKNAGNELKDYQKKYGIEGIGSWGLHGFPQSTFYSTEEVIRDVEAKNPFYLSFFGIVSASLLLCAVLILGLMLCADYESLQRKYRMLDTIGMPEKKLKSNIRSEVMYDTWISLTLAAITLPVYIWFYTYILNINGRPVSEHFIITWLVIVAVYIGINCLISEGIALYMKHLLIGKQEKEEAGVE